MLPECMMASFARCYAFAKSGRVVVFDTETTGMSNCDQIVQIAAEEYVDGERSRTFACYIRPTCPMSPFAEKVHHLSRAFLETNGISPCEALHRFYAFVGDKVLLVGHNVRFDLRMLKNECRAFGFVSESHGIEIADTVHLAKEAIPGLSSYRLENLIAELGLDAANTHDAFDDAHSCGKLFFGLLNMRIHGGYGRGVVGRGKDNLPAG